MTSAAPDSRARSATCTTIGLPAISASALPGSREEAKRAGMTTTKSGTRHQARGARDSQAPNSAKPEDGEVIAQNRPEEFQVFPGKGEIPGASCLAPHTSSSGGSL